VVGGVGVVGRVVDRVVGAELLVQGYAIRQSVREKLSGEFGTCSLKPSHNGPANWKRNVVRSK
jgi:hypothetical protein